MTSTPLLTAVPSGGVLELRPGGSWIAVNAATLEQPSEISRRASSAGHRMADTGQTEFQLLIDVRGFRVAVDSKPAAEIALSARIVDRNDKVVASPVRTE